MPEIAIIGSGLAGLTAAVTLSSKGFKVHLFEGSKKGGGRAGSFPFTPAHPLDNSQKEYQLDNGQHIMMGCYHETLSLLREISAIDKISIQDKMEVKVIGNNQKSYMLKSGSMPYPLSLLQALMGFDLLNFREKLSAVKFVNQLKSLEINSLDRLTVKEWLDQNGQTGALSTGLWEILCIGTLNTSPDKASASIFARILKIVFLGGKVNSKIVVPAVNLSSLFVEPAIRFIRSRGGTVEFSTPVNMINSTNSSSFELISRDQSIGYFPDVIFAVPHHALKKINGIEQHLPSIPNRELEYSSITTFHLFLKINPLKDDFLALTGSPVQWVFNHGDYITTVTSSSSNWDKMSESDILKIIVSELKKYLNLNEAEIYDYKMVKEKRATFVCGGENLKHRLGCCTENPGLFFAGDWTDTGLPATIEGAVLSGRTAAHKIIQKYS
jgi:squalene-associated FAD-dependent desaturase